MDAGQNMWTKSLLVASHVSVRCQTPFSRENKLCMRGNLSSLFTDAPRSKQC